MKLHPAQWSTKERKRMYFDELDLNDNVLDALYDMRFDTCTPVQEKCIPEILEGHDVLGVAQTGTGKTAAYLLPVLSKLMMAAIRKTPSTASSCRQPAS